MGDCYFISSLGTIADKDPAAIEDMFINNGDGTYTVRFYTGNYGASYNSQRHLQRWFLQRRGTADYVTVNLSLPTTSSGMLYYSDYGSMLHQRQQRPVDSLGRKSLCRVEPDGQRRPRRHRIPTLHRRGLDGHGRRASARPQRHRYYMSSSTEQELINALAAGEAVTIGTNRPISTASTARMPTRLPATTPRATRSRSTIPGVSINRANSLGANW